MEATLPDHPFRTSRRLFGVRDRAAKRVTNLDLAVQLCQERHPERVSGRNLGTSFESIERAEDVNLFKELCESLGEPVLPSHIASMSIEEAVSVAEQIGYPVVLRPALLSVVRAAVSPATTRAELREMMRNALSLACTPGAHRRASKAI